MNHELDILLNSIPDPIEDAGRAFASDLAMVDHTDDAIGFMADWVCSTLEDDEGHVNLSRENMADAILYVIDQVAS